MIHPLQILQSLDPVTSEDPIKRAGNLESLRNMMGQGLVQQQQIQAGNDAAGLRQQKAAMQQQLQQILTAPGAIGPDGIPTKETFAKVSQIDPEHAGNLMKAFGQDPDTLSQISTRNATRKTAEEALTETGRHNRAMEAPKPIEVSAGATLVPPTQQLPYTAPAKEGAERNIDPLSPEGIEAAYQRDLKLSAIPNRSSGGITPTAESNLIGKLTSQWEKASKDVQELYRANTIMDAGMKAARSGDLNAGSQAVLVTFQKFLDPTSVVRESEYARSGAGQSMANRVTGAVEKLAAGGAGMTLPELEKFAAMGKEIASNLNKEGASLLSAQKKRIKATADRYKVPIDTIIPDYDYAKPAGETPTIRKYNPATGKIE